MTFIPVRLASYIGPVVASRGSDSTRTNRANLTNNGHATIYTDTLNELLAGKFPRRLFCHLVFLITQFANFFKKNLLYSIILCSLLLWPLCYSIFLIDSYFSFNVIIISSNSFLSRFVFYFIISASGNKSTKEKQGYSICCIIYIDSVLCLI